MTDRRPHPRGDAEREARTVTNVTRRRLFGRNDYAPEPPPVPAESNRGRTAAELELLTDYGIDQRQLDETSAAVTRLAVAAFNARRRGVLWGDVADVLDNGVTELVAEIDRLGL